MTPESMESYRAIQASLLGLEREIGDLKAAVRGIASSIETSAEARQVAREEHHMCRAALEKRMDSFEEDANARIDSIDSRQDKLLTWGKAIALIGGFVSAVLVVLTIMQSVGVHL